MLLFIGGVETIVDQQHVVLGSQPILYTS